MSPGRMALAYAVLSRQLQSALEPCALQEWVGRHLLRLFWSYLWHVSVFAVFMQGAGIGDVFVSTGKLHHDRRIPLPGFDKQVGHCCLHKVE